MLTTARFPLLLGLPILLASGQNLDGGRDVILADAHLTTAVGGLDRTGANSQIVPVPGPGFSKSLQVTIARPADETNWTQLTIPNSESVHRDDAILAEFWIRGSAADKSHPARIEFLFEKAVDPWTKSVTQAVAAGRNPTAWKHVFVAFQAADNYQPGDAMTSFRFATQPQTVFLGGLSIKNFGKTKTLEQLNEYILQQSSVGDVPISVDFRRTKQTLMGMGGNFCQPRYGEAEPMDAVGNYVLSHLHVVHARIGMPLNDWEPEKDVFKDEGQAKAAMLQLAMMNRRYIPTVISIWEGPTWLLGGRREQNGRVLDPAKYGDCIDGIVKFLVTARDKYNGTADYLTFNEADYGINFKFSPAQIADFIRQAGPRLAAAGLKTKFIVGDTGNGANFYGYARPQLEDKSIAPYVGPVAFHCWDALTASDESYERIAELGKQYNKPIWCLEAGHDPGLWQKKDPWGTWDNAMRTAMAYERTLRLSGASLIDYWTYEDNYPLVDKNGPKPYPVFGVMKQMEAVLTPNSKILTTSVSVDGVQALATMGPDKGKFGMFIVNASGAGRAQLSGLPAGAKVTVYVSDRDGTGRRLGEAQVVDRAGHLTLPLPVRSVVSLVAR